MEPVFLLQDEDGDQLELKVPGGFGEPVVTLGVTQDGDYCAVRLNTRAVTDLIRGLTRALVEAEMRYGREKG